MKTPRLSKGDAVSIFLQWRKSLFIVFDVDISYSYLCLLRRIDFFP